MKGTYTKELLDQLRLFTRLSGVEAKDIFGANGVLYFIVEAQDIGRAIGRQGAAVKRLQQALRRTIKIIAFDEDAAQFVRNLIQPIAASCAREGDVITIRSGDRASKGLLIGRNAKNLNTLRSVVQRYFPVDIQIV